jgi:hypothetical protein
MNLHDRIAAWRARIALCAVLLVLFSVADNFFCGPEDPAQSVAVAEHAHDAGDPGEADCAYGHCHHVVPMPAAAPARLARTIHDRFETRLAVGFHSADSPALDHPPKA